MHAIISHKGEKLSDCDIDAKEAVRLMEAGKLGDGKEFERIIKKAFVTRVFTDAHD